MKDEANGLQGEQLNTLISLQNLHLRLDSARFTMMR